MNDDDSGVEPTRVARRRRVPGGRQRAYKVRVTVEEEARLVAAAEARHMSVATLLYEAATSGGADAAAGRRDAVAGMFALERLLLNIANNVNQVAKVANSTGAVPGEASAVLAAARRAIERIEDAADAVAGT